MVSMWDAVVVARGNKSLKYLGKRRTPDDLYHDLRRCVKSTKKLRKVP